MKKGYEKFQHAILEVAQHHIGRLIKDHRDEMAIVMKNSIFDLDGQKRLDRKLDSKEEFFSRVFNGFIEISKSLETLDDIRLYIGRFPFQRTRITRERYLQFHIEAYLSEMYIFRERLIQYMKMIVRQNKADKSIHKAVMANKAAIDIIYKALDQVIITRSNHVHKYRFSDDDIDRLGSLTLLSMGSDAELVKLTREFYREEHKRIRKIWCGRIKDNNKQVRKLLDIYFDSLFLLVFEENGLKLRYPARLAI